MSYDTDTDAKAITITLTNRPPVTVRLTDWPLIASGDWNNSTNGIDRDASRSAWLKVREHRDGRRIVYGVMATRWQGERDIEAGELIPAPAGLTAEQIAEGDTLHLGDTAATVAAIGRVAESLGRPEVAQPCIADLPPEAL